MVTQPKSPSSRDRHWVMLSYRVPREPSTPRIAIWRRLKDLGVAQVGDGLVALPQSPDSQEQLEWVSVKVREASGEAIVWLASPAARRDTDRLVIEMTDARNDEYQKLLDEISATSTADSRTIARWRREHRRIERRDYFGASAGESVRIALLDRASEKDRVSS